MVSAEWIPRMLTKDQNKSRLDISKYLLSVYEDDPDKFMRRVVTKDEIWVHHFDPEAKKQSMQWKHPGSSPPKKFKRVPSAGKVMVSIFWDSQRVMITYLEESRTISTAYSQTSIARWLVYHGQFELVFESLRNSSSSLIKQIFKEIFLFYQKLYVVCTPSRKHAYIMLTPYTPLL